MMALVTVVTLDSLFVHAGDSWPVLMVHSHSQEVIVNGQQEQDGGRGGHEGVREDHTPMCQIIFPGPICRIDCVQY